MLDAACELALECLCFACQRLDAPGEQLQRQRAGGALAIAAGGRAQPGTAGQQLRARLVLQLLAQLAGGAEQGRSQLVEGGGASADRALAAGKQRAQRRGRLTQPRSGARAAGQEQPGRPFGVEAVRLQPRAGRSTSSTRSPRPTRKRARPAP